MKEAYEQLAALLVEGEEKKALQLVREWRDKLPLMEVHEEIITPAMYHVGELWKRNEISVADEHLATAICDYIMTLLSPRNYETHGRKAVFFNVEEEEHHLGLKMAADLFREEGWEARFLGSGVPNDHVLAQIEKFQPEVICVSASLSYRVPSLQKIIRILRERIPEAFILIGGRIVKNYGREEWNESRVQTLRTLPEIKDWLIREKEGVFDEKI
ncbi:cobalamin B12-binding domain-containing protein [Salimicrobium flavidum]|uniref:Methanogenic corrinoid protein MtbC1 n=1 Tax=Salimicrobium flavidum TaxID=570947 RepID=A0A1N7J2R9_9BACI|nr:cobalamin-dependent protein [Salimicrobium flavidum]SIS43599.1 Methanogenic corrinoid protein MtbC1 [Salimicrobium flavidum]